MPKAILGAGDKNYCDQMNVRRLLLNPGDSLARKFDKGYARLVAQMKRKIKRGDRRLSLYSILARAECGLAFAVGVLSSYLGYVIFIPLVLCFYPLVVLGDPYVWRKTYGRLAKGVGCRASFLLNLDMLYWFAVGWVVGWAIP